MSAPARWQPGAAHLDLWLRDSAILSACAERERTALANWPLRWAIQYNAALGLAHTLEHALRHSLYYAQIWAQNPGAAMVEQQARNLRAAAATALDEPADRGGAILNAAVSEALNCLPFTPAENLAQTPEAFLAVGQDEVAALMSFASSGSTGPGKRVFCTEGDLEGTVAFFEHGMRYLLDAAGGERVALLMSTLHEARGGNLGLLFSRAMERLGVPCLVAGFPVNEGAMLRRLAEFAPTCIVGLPRHVISLFRCGAGPGDAALAADVASGLRTVLLSGDSISQAQARVIEETLRCRVFRHYGMAETGLGTAVECGARSGCHWRELEYIFEIITAQGEAVLPRPGVDATPWGEIAVSTIGREGTPLLRYRTGDMGRIVTAPCACGSALWRLEVQGRKSNALELGAPAKALTAEDFDACLYPLPWVKDYEVLLGTGPGAEAALPQALLCRVRLAAFAPEDAQGMLRQALVGLARQARAASCAFYLEEVPEGAPLSSLPAPASPKRIFRRVGLPFGSGAVKL